MPRTTWSQTAALSSHKNQFTVFGSAWVTIHLHWSLVVGWQSFHSMDSVFSFAMCFMSQTFVLHVPDLWAPLYSLRAHLHQSGCSFVGSYETGLHVYFPGVVLTVDTSLDCHLAYKPLGKTAPLSSLHYVQPQCPTVVYPPDLLAFLA